MSNGMLQKLFLRIDKALIENLAFGLIWLLWFDHEWLYKDERCMESIVYSSCAFFCIMENIGRQRERLWNAVDIGKTTRNFS